LGYLWCYFIFIVAIPYFVSGHHSTVTIVLTENEDRTELALTQTGVPEAKYEETLEGWKQYYWEAIKRTFSCGFRYF
jgi:activator of HSP90 ATPase